MTTPNQPTNGEKCRHCGLINCMCDIHYERGKCHTCGCSPCQCDAIEAEIYDQLHVPSSTYRGG